MTRVPIHHVVVLSTLRTEQFAGVLALVVPVALFAALLGDRVRRRLGRGGILAVLVIALTLAPTVVYADSGVW